MHDSYPQPGCDLCEKMARQAGHEGVQDYLDKAAQSE